MTVHEAQASSMLGCTANCCKASIASTLNSITQHSKTFLGKSMQKEVLVQKPKVQMLNVHRPQTCCSKLISLEKLSGSCS